MKHILVLDLSATSTPFLCYFLRLAGYRTTWVYTPLEILNWACSRQSLGSPFDLLLICIDRTDLPLAEMVARLRSAGVTAPILVSNPPELSLGRDLGEEVHACTPSEVITKMSILLSLEGFNRKEENHGT